MILGQIVAQLQVEAAAGGSSLDKLRQLPAALSDAVENWYYDTMLLF